MMIKIRLTTTLALLLATAGLAGCGGSGSNPLVPQLRPVTGGVVSSGYGPRDTHPVTGATGTHHHGYDFAVATGSPVRAAMDGEVVFAGWKGGYGNTIVLKHAEGYGTLYGHASSLSAAVGDKVARGQVIALVGSTGLSTGPHLHYELRKNGYAVDPGGFIGDLDEAPVANREADFVPASYRAPIQREPKAAPKAAAKPVARKLTKAPESPAWARRHLAGFETLAQPVWPAHLGG